MSKKVAPVARSQANIVGIRIGNPGILVGGYHYLSDAPEVASAVWCISDMIATMTILEMENAKGGNVRLNDALAQKIDIMPWSGGTRATLMQWISATMLLQGQAFVLPITHNGQLEDLVPMPDAVAQSDWLGSYTVSWHDEVFLPDDVLHFRLRPDLRAPWKGQGVQVQLGGVVQGLLQANKTKLAYMSSEYKPPLIVSVSSDSDLSDEEKRTELVEKFLKRKNLDEPLILPADLMRVSQVKPLSLTDLAIKDGIELDTRTVASIFKVPVFWLGVGSFDRAAHNAGITTAIKPLAYVIQQEMTKKLLISPKRFFRLNVRSLYSYELKDLADIGCRLAAQGLMTGNEVRDWLDLQPKDGLDQLTTLENYVPVEMLGKQKKLIQDEE